MSTERSQLIISRFDARHRSIVAMLESSAEADAERVTDASEWTAAQVGYHVATVDIGFSRVLDGRVPGVVELPEGYSRPWKEVARTVPRMAAPENVRPPEGVARGDALQRLAYGGAEAIRALDALTVERGDRFGWSHPLLGLLSLFELGEWLVAHTRRHQAQMARVLAASSKMMTL